MSYRSAVYGMDHWGIPSGPASITCDCCGLQRPLDTFSRRMPPAWLLAGKPIPGWGFALPTEYTRYDACPPCVKSALGVGAGR